VINALVTIVNDDYIGRLLKPEEQKLSVSVGGIARDKSPKARDSRRIFKGADASVSVSALTDSEYLFSKGHTLL
jgi:hypothetical protein